ncbi:MAG: redox-sensing transcriptional repressor Rex [Christensenellaceae bacterium]|nr:redox-sensing transcriptional repressor Rex [Christensenellaceae bacterium]
MAGRVSEAVIRRLPGYYRHLCELETAGVTQISSQELGKRMQLTPSQIRQDINCFGGFGRQGYGYRVPELKAHIGDILGLNKAHRVIIIGAGNIGSAVAQYPDFARGGFKTVALFDVSAEKIGVQVGNIPVRGMDELEDFLRTTDVDIAVLATPASCAQETLNRLCDSGIRAVWNFAPVDLRHPEGVAVVNVHLSDSLQILSYKMLHHDNGEPEENA